MSEAQDFVVESRDASGDVDGVITGMVLRHSEADGYALTWLDPRVDEVHRAYVLRGTRALEATYKIAALAAYLGSTGTDRSDVYLCLNDDQNLTVQQIVGIHPSRAEDRMSDLTVFGDGSGPRDVWVAKWLGHVNATVREQGAWYGQRAAGHPIDAAPLKLEGGSDA